MNRNNNFLQMLFNYSFFVLYFFEACFLYKIIYLKINSFSIIFHDIIYELVLLVKREGNYSTLSMSNV